MDGDEVDEESSSGKYKTYSEVFDEQFAEYLALGMTYEQYWYGDVTLVRDYRKAYQIQFERQRDLMNWHAWLQGWYVYDALVEVAPYFNSLKPKEPSPYNAKPYELKRADPVPEASSGSQDKKQEAEHEQMINARNIFHAIAMEFNKNRKKRGEDNAGSR